MYKKSFSALLTLSFVSAPVLSLTSATFGQSKRVRNIYGQLEWVEIGNLSQVLGWLFLAGYLILAIHAFLPSGESKSAIKMADISSRKGPAIALATALVLSAISVLWNRTAWPMQNLATLLIFCVCTFVAFREEVSPLFQETLSKLSLLIVGLSVIFAFFNPEYSVTPCRLDKCTEAGFLLNSFFPHENYFAMFLLASIPFLRSIQRAWLRRASVAGYLVLMYLTGSRVAYFAIAVFLVFWVMKKLNVLLLAVPFAMAFSAAVFLTIRGTDFTDRGLIYTALWIELKDKFLLGSGPTTLSAAFAHGNLPGFLPSHEHGFAPHIITNLGVLCFLALLVYATLAVLKTKGISTGSFQVTFLMPIALLFLTAGTETPILISAIGPFSWAWYLFVSTSQHKIVDEVSAR